jgi:hypothetical protein
VSISVAPAGGPADVSSPRALHGLVAAGTGAFVVGGAGALGALGDMHLLHDTAVMQVTLIVHCWSSSCINSLMYIAFPPYKRPH